MTPQLAAALDQIDRAHAMAREPQLWPHGPLTALPEPPLPGWALNPNGYVVIVAEREVLAEMMDDPRLDQRHAAFAFGSICLYQVGHFNKP